MKAVGGRIVLIVGLIGILFFTGTSCTRPIPQDTSASFQQTGRLILLKEVERLLSNTRKTRYAHPTFVDEPNGQFHFDCSGFLFYALKRVLPSSLVFMKIDPPERARPLAEDFHAHILKAGYNGGKNGWKQIASASDLLPGDIIAWLRPPNTTRTDTGHVMVVRELPYQNKNRPSEWLIRVIDSTQSPHAEDTRLKPTNGLGSGIIGLVVDREVHPTGFYWRGNESKQPQTTHIVLGRIE